MRCALCWIDPRLAFVIRMAPPTIGWHLDIGAGAKLLGALTFGDHLKVDANSVGLHDVPTHASADGNLPRL